MKTLWVVLLYGAFCASGWARTVSPLFARGYTVLPEPQKVTLGSSDFTFGSSWPLKLEGIPSNDVSVETLRQDLAGRFNVTLGQRSKTPGGVLTLRIAPGSVQIGEAQDPDRAALEEQAYRIDMKRQAVTIAANAPTGLFYGVETLVQLLRPSSGALWLPEGGIVDWPDLRLRQIFWDDDHHLERIDAFKRALRQAAFYKINGFVVRLNGHFQYKSAPAVVDPYALSPAQLQELTDYGLRYHVQLIPYVDGPAHSAWILKYPQYKSLRAFPNSNYEFCATNPATYKLLEGIYQDLMDANKGVKYFYVSTDEPYYVGLAHNSQCDEAAMAKKRGSVGEVEAHFVNTAGRCLHDHGRTVVFWGEYPLKPTDIPALSSYLVDGETYGPKFDRAFHKQGIRQMIYTSSGGDHTKFPSYFPLPATRKLHPERRVPRRGIQFILDRIAHDSARADSAIIGEINAGWGDQGINPETFWLGFVALGAAGWHPGSPSASEVTNSFYPLFYGQRVLGMDRLYRMMSFQSQAYSDSWDTVPSTHRKPIWGGSYKIYEAPHPADDPSIPLPPAPTADLSYHSAWSKDNMRRVNLASRALEQNGILLGLLYENLHRAQFNRDNLEVYLSIAMLCRQNFQMIGQIAEMDRDLKDAAKLNRRDPAKAIAMVDRALDTATLIWRQRNQALQNATQTWYHNWEPRVAEANGRRFLHILSDVKDHLADRTVDMSYLVYGEKILPFGPWVNAIAKSRNEFAEAHNLPARNYQMKWDALNAPTREATCY
ncbi:MAG: glycoside hydrolase family 20 zincin-like fold domain-containing protein [Terriglobia bacterium]